MKDFTHIFSNHLINIGFLGWFIAQLLKVIAVFVECKKLDFSRFVGSGGMPSSHAATMASTSTGILYICGFNSVEFALALFFSLIVMYDAAGVRRATGEQAKILNKIIYDWNIMDEKERIFELKELIGHTKFQVFLGSVLGIAVALLYIFIFKI